MAIGRPARRRSQQRGITHRRCAILLRRHLPIWLCIAPSKGDQHDHDRAGVPRQRASMPVLGRVGERSGKQGRILRPCRDLGQRCRSDRARRPDREIDRCAGDQSKPRSLTPSGGCGLTVPVDRPLWTVRAASRRWRRCAAPCGYAAPVDRVANQR